MPPSARPTLMYGYGSVDTRRTEVMSSPVFADDDAEVSGDPRRPDAGENDAPTERYPGVPAVLIAQCRETSMFPSSLDDDESTPTVSTEAGQPTLRMRPPSARASRKMRRAAARERHELEAVSDDASESRAAIAALHRDLAKERMSMFVEVAIAVLVAAALVLGLSALISPA